MTIADVLAPYGVGEDDFVEELTRDLRAVPDTAASRLTDIEESILRDHGGIGVTADEGAVRKAVLR